MTTRTHRSIVSTKYGDRPLIDVPPISVAHVTHQRLQNPRYQVGNLADDLNIPPRTHESIMPVYPTKAPAHGYRHENPYGNLVQNSNVIPYQNVPQPYQNGGYPQSYQTGSGPGHHSSYQNNGYGYQDPSGEFHHFYGPHGERLPGPILNMNFAARQPVNFKLKGKLKFGQMTSIEVIESNISYRDLPDAVIRDLKRLYGHIDKTDVTIIAENGEYHIYATPKITDVSTAQPGYMYDTRPGRITADPYSKKHIKDDVLYKYDPYSKKFYVDPRSYSVASEGRRPRDYREVEEPRRPMPKPVRRDF